MNDVAELQELIRQLVSGIQQVMQSGEVLSDEFQGMVAQTIQLAMARIEELQIDRSAEEPQLEPPQPVPQQRPAIPTGEPVPELEAAPHASSNINAFRYDPQSQTLFVKFQGKYPQQNGPVYKYGNVPPFVNDVFSRGAVGPRTSGSNAWHTWRRGVTPSHGAAMAALVKAGGYPYQRMT
jgi:KTSC domain